VGAVAQGVEGLGISLDEPVDHGIEPVYKLIHNCSPFCSTFALFFVLGEITRGALPRNFFTNPPNIDSIDSER
jgi:hypothetical protein